MGCECIYGSNISTNASLYKHRHAYPQRDANAQQQVNSQRESIRASSRTVKLSARPSARASCLAASIARRFWLVFTCCRDKLGRGIGEGLEASARFSTSSTPPGFSRSHRSMRCASDKPLLGPRSIHFVDRARSGSSSRSSISRRALKSSGSLFGTCSNDLTVCSKSASIWSCVHLACATGAAALTACTRDPNLGGGLGGGSVRLRRARRFFAPLLLDMADNLRCARLSSSFTIQIQFSEIRSEGEGSLHSSNFDE